MFHLSIGLKAKQSELEIMVGMEKMTDFSNAYEEGLTWQEIMSELDGIDDMVEKDNEEWADPKFRNQVMSGTNKGKLRHECVDEWHECSEHQIKHRGAAGGCPLCLLRTFFEEKQRIGEQGY